MFHLYFVSKNDTLFHTQCSSGQVTEPEPVILCGSGEIASIGSSSHSLSASNVFVIFEDRQGDPRILATNFQDSCWEDVTSEVLATLPSSTFGTPFASTYNNQYDLGNGTAGYTKPYAIASFFDPQRQHLITAVFNGTNKTWTSCK